jgi:hypothetical protein
MKETYVQDVSSKDCQTVFINIVLFTLNRFHTWVNPGLTVKQRGKTMFTVSFP